MDSKKSIKSKIIAHLDGELDVDGMNELFEWIKQSKENERFFIQVKDIWEATLYNASEIAETEKEWNKFRLNIKKRKLPIGSGLYIIRNWWKVAAIFIVGLIIGSLLIQLIGNSEPEYFTSIAPKGSVSQIFLPDSTMVFLNAGSEIKYKIDSKSKYRELILNGEAWFHVTRMEKKPFIVRTPFYDVKVLGTKFNVKAYQTDSKIETTLEEGKVLVSSSDIFKMAEEVILSPGEQLLYDKANNQLQVKKVNTSLYTSWKENKLIFINMNLNELIVLMERKYGVDIELDSNLDYHYSGTIKNETIFELLEIIKHTLPIQYKIDGQKILIYKN